MGFCENNLAFRSLKYCRDTCLYEIGLSNRLPIPDSRQKRFHYKVIALNKEEYSISPIDGILTILDTDFPVRHFGFGDYFVSGNSVKICYPFQSEFYACNKYQLPAEETEFIDHSVLVDGQRRIDAASFFVYKNYTILCDSDTKFKALEIVQFVACILSAFFLLLTLFAHHRLKLKLKLNFGLFCHICMLFCGYTLLSIKLIVPVTVPHFCLTIALFQQFSFLSAFFWLNVQSAQLHKTLKNDAKPPLRLSTWLVVFCSLYACGVPLAITVCTMLAEILQLEPFYPYFEQNCWFLLTDRATAFLFYYGPMTWTLVVNIVFFVGIVWNLRQVGKNVQLVNKNIHKQLFFLCIKLLVVMCFCWFAKIAFWGVGILESVWSYMDVITYFQGIFIFFVYACKKTVLRTFTSVFKKSLSTTITHL